MYQIILSKQYQRAIKKVARSGRYKISEIEKVVNLIAAGKKLEAQYKDHALKGSLAQYRECHIYNDLLLVYYIRNEELILALINIGSHSELFN